MIVLPTAYFAPIAYYALLMHEPEEVVIDIHEHYQKQTIRNRCWVASDQGPQKLSCNVVKGRTPGTPICDIRLSDHGNWMHQHLYALATNYGNTPFYEFYIDEIREVMEHGHDGTLVGLNEALRRKICEFIGLEPRVRYSTEYMGGVSSLPEITGPTYYQIHASRQPFMPGLSILDLLFNMGPESILVLNAIRFGREGVDSI